MLERLELSNLGLIESAALDLVQGLVVVTGETGAGKTMLFEAVRTLAGEKPGLLREGSDAEVQGWLHVVGSDLLERINDQGALIDGDSVQISRIFPAAGRARTLLGGRVVPAPVLAELAQDWLAVHGQHDSQRLLKTASHRQLLDRFGGAELGRVLDAYRKSYSDWLAVRRQLADAEKLQQELLATAEALKADLAICDSLNLQPGEDAEIAQRIERLSSADQIQAAVEVVAEEIQGEGGAAARAAAAERALRAAMPQDAEAILLAERLKAARYELQEVAAEVSTLADGLEADPAELDALMLRQRQLRSLLLRHGPELSDLMSWMERTRGQLGLIDPNSPELQRLRQQAAAAESATIAGAAELTAGRRAAAQSLDAAVTGELRELAMPHALFETDIQPASLGEHGADRIEFRFSANPGLARHPIAQAASGGELSRLMLALEVVLVSGPAAESDPSTMLFDEVDAGVAGAAAISVAERLARLARHRQVMVVTHLPQIAAFADQHIVVTKSSDGSVTSSEISNLAESDRPAEIARLLAGMGESASALAHAGELLDHANKLKGTAP